MCIIHSLGYIMEVISMAYRTCCHFRVCIVSKAAFVSDNSHKKPEVSIYQDKYFIMKIGEGLLFPFHLRLFEKKSLQT